MNYQVGERVRHRRNGTLMIVESVSLEPTDDPVLTCSWSLNGATLTGEFRDDDLESVDPRYQADFIVLE